MFHLIIYHFIKIACYELKFPNAIIIRDIIAEMLTISKTCQVGPHKLMDSFLETHYPGQYLLHGKDHDSLGLSSLTNMGHAVYTLRDLFIIFCHWVWCRLGLLQLTFMAIILKFIAVACIALNNSKWTYGVEHLRCRVMCQRLRIHQTLYLWKNKDSQLEAENSSSKQ